MDIFTTGIKIIGTEFGIVCRVEHMHNLRTNNSFLCFEETLIQAYLGRCEKVHSIIVCNGRKPGNNPNIINRRKIKKDK